VREDFLEVEPCEYGPSPTVSYRENWGGTEIKVDNFIEKLSPSQPMKSGEHSSPLPGSRSIKGKVQYATATKQPGPAAGLAIDDNGQQLHPNNHSNGGPRSPSDANLFRDPHLVRDSSTGQLLQKLNSNFFPIE